MRRFPLILLLAAGVFASIAASPKSPEPARPVDFTTQIQPILEGKCQPCHFSGGTMYEKRPFDKPATIVALGEKLFTRIKDENSRVLIRTFLAEQKLRETRPPAELSFRRAWPSSPVSAAKPRSTANSKPARTAANR